MARYRCDQPILGRWSHCSFSWLLTYLDICGQT